MRTPTHRRRGFALAAAAICFPVLFAMLGLVSDAGRMMAAKTELQAFSDAAALAAAGELDGTEAGLDRARAVAATGPLAGDASNRWDFSTKAVAGVTTSFARLPIGPFDPAPTSPSGYRFVRLAVTASVPLYFLPILPGVGSHANVPVATVAGQAREFSIGEGVSPFSPDAHDPSDPDFGFTAGEHYTLKWPPLSNRKKGNLCPGDEGFTPGGSSDDRGYVDIGQGSGDSGLHDAIVDNRFNLDQPITPGTELGVVGGNKHVGPAVDERFNQDTDRSSTTYAAYHGNGRRVLIVPVNDNSAAGVVIGFAAFFLPPAACGHNNTRPCCAEYLGPAVAGGAHQGAGQAGLYTVKLFR